MYLSYSAFKLNQQCPYAYWHRYVNKTFTPPENGINALYGTIIGGVFEVFYRDRLWRYKDYIDRMRAEIEPQFKMATTNQKNRMIDWADEKANYHDKATLIKDVEESIPRGLQVIKEHRFLGPMAEAEMKLDRKFPARDKDHVIGGRADFVIQRTAPFGDLVLLDGKGSKHREKYVDGHALKEGQKVEGVQLKWYAMLYQAHFNRVPDRLGYVFWRFEGDRAVEWVPFTQESLDRLRNEVLSTMDRLQSSIAQLESVSGQRQSYDDLRQELFPAQPSEDCRLCSYVNMCEEGAKKIESLRRSKPKVSLPVAGVLDGLCLEE